MATNKQRIANEAKKHHLNSTNGKVHEFHSFQEWIALGYTVNKGEKHRFVQKVFIAKTKRMENRAFFDETQVSPIKGKQASPVSTPKAEVKASTKPEAKKVEKPALHNATSKYSEYRAKACEYYKESQNEFWSDDLRKMYLNLAIQFKKAALAEQNA